MPIVGIFNSCNYTMSLSLEQVKKAFDSASPELRFLFSKHKVDDSFQATLYDAGITEVAAWAAARKRS